MSTQVQVLPNFQVPNHDTFAFLSTARDFKVT